MNSCSSFSIESITRATFPFSVNLNALLKKLTIHCLSLVSSAVISPSTLFLMMNSLLFFVARGPETSLMVSIMVSIENGVKYISILPASIFERSNTLLISDNKCLLEFVIRFKSGIISSLPRSSQSSKSISLYPIIALSGVRSS